MTVNNLNFWLRTETAAAGWPVGGHEKYNA